MTDKNVVIVTAGKDKGKTFLVTGREGDRVYIVNGRRVKAQRPKAKNPRHVRFIASVPPPDPLTNKNVLSVLRLLNDSTDHKEET